jgi:hypothetical protein
MPEGTFSFDLHVLSMQPAFNLSQDQTLQFNPLCQYKLAKLLFGSLQYISIPPCFPKNWCLRILLTQAPAQICLMIFYISVTTLIRNSHKKIITCININDVYDFFIGSHKRSQRDERLYTGKRQCKGIYGF